MVGPPGTGKSMLAARFPGLLPPLSDEEALETAALASLGSAGFHPENWRRRPFRAPHHSASSVALVGGGSDPRPGEISLAHHGVLFLDALPGVDRRGLGALREPRSSPLPAAWPWLAEASIRAAPRPAGASSSSASTGSISS